LGEIDRVLDSTGAREDIAPVSRVRLDELREVFVSPALGG
jgi:hypothetical protein